MTHIISYIYICQCILSNILYTNNDHKLYSKGDIQCILHGSHISKKYVSPHGQIFLEICIISSV